MEQKNLIKSLAAFQQEVPTILKDTEGYGYSYADLPKIFEVINPLLKTNGLGFTQLINGEILETIVFHIESGESISSKVNIPQGVQLKGQNDFQVMGSAITYLRRYSLSAMLGLVTDKDTDAHGEQTKPSAKPQKQKLDVSSESFIMARNAVASGSFTVARIREKYDLSPEAEKELAEAETGFKSQQK